MAVAHWMISAVFTVVLLAAAWSDYRLRRIPNALTVAGLAIALAFRAVLGWEPFIDGLVGALLPVLFNCGQILKHWATFGRLGANRSFASVGALTIPYGIAIAAGALLWWFVEMGSL